MQTQLPGYYTLEEACKALGYRGKSTLSTKAKEGKMPSYRVANIVLIPAYWVDEEIKKGPANKGAHRGRERTT